MAKIVLGGLGIIAPVFICIGVIGITFLINYLLEKYYSSKIAAIWCLGWILLVSAFLPVIISGSKKIKVDIGSKFPQDDINTATNSSYEYVQEPVEESFVPDCGVNDYLDYGMNPGGSTAGGFLVKQGDWIYFIVNRNLYKQNNYGGTYIILSDLDVYMYDLVRGGCSLNICGDYLYFVSGAGEGNISIERVRTDGKQHEILVTGLYSKSLVCDRKANCIWYVGEDYIGSARKTPMYCKYDLSTMTVVQTIPINNVGSDSPSAAEIVGSDDKYIVAKEAYGMTDTGAAKTVHIGVINKTTGEYTSTETEYMHFSAKPVYNEGKAYFGKEAMFDQKIVEFDVNTKKSTVVIEGVPFSSMLTYNDGFLVTSSAQYYDVSKFPKALGYSGNGDIAQKANYIDEYLYYIPLNEESDIRMVCRMRLDGSSWSIIFNEDTVVARCQ